ncbi:YnfC family lipoprotein [Pseudocitrobacter cyperus]|uniref:UPF0257 lipoprotein VSR74_02705 n=1 Tax=Pseudocitrobacter cyperus TaxID=3112843 RepID=A0ABV0HDZ8_9ENTR
MKRLLLLTPLLVLLAGCDKNDSPAAFSPEMASFSNEFDFDPLRGPVKDFSQTLMNEKGEVAKRVSGRMSEEGCFDVLEFHDLENETGATLVLDANYYVDGITQEKKVRLQGKCQLAELPAAGVAWETNDEGFVVKSLSKDREVEYQYDKEGYPLGKTSQTKGDTLAIMSTPSEDPRKKLDYTSVTLFNKQPVGNVKQRCDYDRHDNPLNCELEMIDMSVNPATTLRYTIKNVIDYY